MSSDILRPDKARPIPTRHGDVAVGAHRNAEDLGEVSDGLQESQISDGPSFQYTLLSSRQEFPPRRTESYCVQVLRRGFHFSNLVSSRRPRPEHAIVADTGKRIFASGAHGSHRSPQRSNCSHAHPVRGPPQADSAIPRARGELVPKTAYRVHSDVVANQRQAAAVLLPQTCSLVPSRGHDESCGRECNRRDAEHVGALRVGARAMTQQLSLGRSSLQIPHENLSIARRRNEVVTESDGQDSVHTALPLVTCEHHAVA
mmetsp:Transcript_43550/g.114974  ORF Transcript_43550/g.114974 Transcript_43550/m.114974 type:complete len:258 (-) Transcript_43550:520-1293(-)